MVDDILYRLRDVFDDTDEVMEWIDTSTYCGAETHEHVTGMHKTMLDAADRIQELEKAFTKTIIAFDKVLYSGKAADKPSAYFVKLQDSNKRIVGIKKDE